MKKYIELNEKELVSVEGGFAIVGFQNATGVASPFRVAGAQTAVGALGSRSVTAYNNQTSVIAGGYTSATSGLYINAR